MTQMTEELTIGPKLSTDRIAYYQSKMIRDGRPVRFLFQGRALAIGTGHLCSKGSNVIYHPVYWGFDETTAKEIANELGVKAVFSD